MWELLYVIQDIVKEYGVDILPEIHEHYTIQYKIAEKGFWNNKHPKLKLRIKGR